MADGDEESGDSQQQDGSNLPDLENLEIAEHENPEDVAQEYHALDGQLNQLDACLDSLEAKNDDLMTKVRAFLQQGSFAQDAAASTANGAEHPGEGGEDAEQGGEQQSSDSTSTGTNAGSS